MPPIRSRRIEAGTIAAVSQPMPMPIMAPGSMTLSRVPLPCLRQSQSEIQSMKMRIGKRIAAAWTGETTMASSGTPIIESASPMPPLVRPTRMTAGIAAR